MIEKIDGGKHAFRLATAFVVALVMILFFAFRDRARFLDLESFEQTTAVGDTTYFKPSNDVNVVATFDGHPLFRIDNEKREIKDTAMRRVGRDPETGITIYIPRKEEDAEKAKKEGIFFVKIGHNDYVRVRSELPVK